MILYDTASGEIQKRLTGHALRVLSIAFSPDGKLLASASNDKTIKLWEVATGKPWPRFAQTTPCTWWT